MGKVVYISPHPDDVILSCGLSVLREKSCGNQVVIVTCFDGGESHAERRLEDEEACKSIGAELISIGLLDAPYRDSRFRSIEGLVFGKTTERDSATIEALSRHLRAIAIRSGVTCLSRSDST
jgi:LmbE family N-acetylglucosaminyl deacetylase